mmetsp:Transcript_47045/g.134666  ORF Transcript_47045/g.134666 Transcript_47045/m.134666 type:complete len:241 (-) Transcript_47045:1201-1923(-)
MHALLALADELPQLDDVGHGRLVLGSEADHHLQKLSECHRFAFVLLLDRGLRGRRGGRAAPGCTRDVGADGGACAVGGRRRCGVQRQAPGEGAAWGGTCGVEARHPGGFVAGLSGAAVVLIRVIFEEKVSERHQVGNVHTQVVQGSYGLGDVDKLVELIFRDRAIAVLVELIEQMHQPRPHIVYQRLFFLSGRHCSHHSTKNTDQHVQNHEGRQEDVHQPDDGHDRVVQHEKIPDLLHII